MIWTGYAEFMEEIRNAQNILYGKREKEEAT
jgi:hypothetical protein